MVEEVLHPGEHGAADLARELPRTIQHPGDPLGKGEREQTAREINGLLKSVITSPVSQKLLLGDEEEVALVAH